MAEVRRSIASLLAETQVPVSVSLPVRCMQPIKGLTGVKQKLEKPLSKRRSLYSESRKDPTALSFDSKDRRHYLDITIANPVVTEEHEARSPAIRISATGRTTKGKSLSLSKNKKEPPSAAIVYPQVKPKIFRRAKVHLVHFDFRSTLRDSPVSVLFKT